jgi:hypothetical protein
VKDGFILRWPNCSLLVRNDLSGFLRGEEFPDVTTAAFLARLNEVVLEKQKVVGVHEKRRAVYPSEPVFLPVIGLDSSLVRTIILGENTVSVVPLREEYVAKLRSWADRVTENGVITAGLSKGKQLIVREVGACSILFQ